MVQYGSKNYFSLDNINERQFSVLWQWWLQKTSHVLYTQFCASPKRNAREWFYSIVGYL